MSNMSLLSITRTWGADNISQLNQLRKGLKTNIPGKYTAHLVFDKSMVDTFQKGILDEGGKSAIELSKSLYPKANSESAQSLIDIVVNRFNSEPLFKTVTHGFRGLLDMVMGGTQNITKFNNNSSAAISLNTVTKVGEEVVSDSSLKILTNNAGKKFSIRGTAESGTLLEADARLSKFKTGDVDMEEVIDNIPNLVKYSVVDGNGALNGAIKTNGFLKEANVKYEAPAELFDAIAEVSSGGNVKNFGEFLSTVTEKHTIADTPTVIINPKDFV